MSLKNAKAKGSRLERRSRDVLRQAGFLVVKAGGSLGPIDLLAIHPEIKGVMAVQVKANRWAGPAERQGLIDLAARFRGDSSWQVCMHRWDDRRGLRIQVI
jgi:Holliday junction resolvase